MLPERNGKRPTLTITTTTHNDITLYEVGLSITPLFTISPVFIYRLSEISYRGVVLKRFGFIKVCMAVLERNGFSHVLSTKSIYPVAELYFLCLPAPQANLTRAIVVFHVCI